MQRENVSKVWEQDGTRIIREAYTEDDKTNQLAAILWSFVAVAAFSVGALIWLSLVGVIQ